MIKTTTQTIVQIIGSPRAGQTARKEALGDDTTPWVAHALKFTVNNKPSKKMDSGQ